MRPPAFWARLREYSPERPALKLQNGQTITYGDLVRRIDAWRHTLGTEAAALGGHRLLVAIELQPEPDLIACYLAALTDAHPVIVGEPLTLGASSRTGRVYRPNLLVTASGPDVSVERLARDAARLHEDLRLLLSTSGSTGDPKLVRLSEQNVASNASAIASYLRLTDADCGITSLPLHYSYGLSVLHSHLAAGASVALTELSVVEPGFGAFAGTAGTTTLSLVPHQIDLLLAQGFAFTSLPGLSRVTQAGGKLAPEKVRKMAALGKAEGWSFYVMYGQTEAAPRIAWLPPEMASEDPAAIGRAIPGGALWIEGAEGEHLQKPGLRGELVYRGPNVMMGYAETRSELALPQGPDTLRTGDIAEWTPAGNIRIVGRAKRFAKLFGLRINLDEVEASLAERGIAAFAASDDTSLVLLVTSEGDVERAVNTAGEILSLPLSAIRYALLDQVPLLSSGKPDRQELDRRAATSLSAGDDRASDDTILAAFRAATRRPNIDASKTYVALGGDSLGYIHVQMAIEERLGHVPEGWEYMPVSVLQAMSPKVGNPTWTKVDPATLLRVLAIAMVVAFHLTLWPIAGGTFMLVILMGYSLAQFQRRALAGGDIVSLLRSLLIPIVPIYLLLLVAYNVARGPVPTEMYVFAGNIPRRLPLDLFEPYWFISLYVQIVVTIGVVSLFTPVQNAIRNRPFAFGVIGVALTSVLSIGFQALWLGGTHFTAPAENGVGPLATRSLPVALPFVLLGWTIFLANTTQQRQIALLAAVGAIACSPFVALNHFLMAGTTILALLFMGDLRLPSTIVRLARHLAAATMFVYLVHNGMVHLAKEATTLHDQLGNVLTLAVFLPASFACGHMAKRIWDAIEAVAIPALARYFGRDAARASGGPRT